MVQGSFIGGVWTNVEDEVLRAAVSKYGLNQWARVSSLLARKTAKQAKSRWYEWLDPSVKKLEWSREEDEKLLHLAKLMPSQWRTIAPIVGRTATQCIERYQQLLDDATNADQSDLKLVGSSDAGEASGAFARQFKPGEIDPAPESRPAKPDAVDMDEDELEMLAEARARLVNTQGKKAKRKARERLLKENNRLSLLQKRRELKLSGVNMKLKHKGGEMDYNADIPFQHAPAPGFFDTSEEKEAGEKERAAFDKRNYNKAGQSSSGNSSEKRSRDKDSSGAAENAASVARAAALSNVNEFDEISKRRKLDLPEPQVVGQELEHIVKSVRQNEQAQRDYGGDGKEEEEEDDSDDAKDVVVDYSEVAIPSVTRPKNYEEEVDTVLQATRDLRDLTETQSSLLGGSSNHLPTQSTSVGSESVVASPGSDDLYEDTEVDSREVLRKGFQTLPKPKNDFVIEMSDEENGDYDDDDEMMLDGDEEEDDAGEILRKEEAMKLAAEKRKLELRSQVLKLGLPRPAPIQSKLPPSNISGAIEAELEMLVLSDLVKYPIPGIEVKSGIMIPDIDEKEKQAALLEIQLEAERSPSDPEIFNEHIKKSYPQEFSFDNPSKKAATRASLKIADALEKVATESNSMEDKLTKVLGGYIKRHEMLSSKIGDAFQALRDAQIEKVSFENLMEMERAALSLRTAYLQEEVNGIVDTERKSQEVYRSLTVDK